MCLQSDCPSPDVARVIVQHPPRGLRRALADRGLLRVSLSARRRVILSKVRKHRAETSAADATAAEALIARAPKRSCNKRTNETINLSCRR